jgi:hypothetical protein
MIVVRLSKLAAAGVLLGALHGGRAPAQGPGAAPAPLIGPPGGLMKPSPCFADPFGPVQITPVPCPHNGRHWGAWHKARCQAKWVGYPEEFNEWPLGWSLHANGQTEVSNATAARMVFYHYDFEDGGSRLNYRGRDKLAMIAALLPTSFAPVVIERTPGDDRLDLERRTVIAGALAHGTFPIPPERVIVGRPIANGLNGQEAVIIRDNLYRQTLQQGTFGLSGATGGSGLTGSGLTGGTTFGAPITGP